MGAIQMLLYATSAARCIYHMMLRLLHTLAKIWTAPLQDQQQLLSTTPRKQCGANKRTVVHGSSADVAVCGNVSNCIGIETKHPTVLHTYVHTACTLLLSPSPARSPRPRYNTFQSPRMQLLVLRTGHCAGLS